MSSYNRTVLVALAAFVLLIATYWPGLHGGFFFDDIANIVENKSVHLKTLDISSLKQITSGAEAGPLGRPVSVVSFALTHYFFGLDPFAFKAVNLAIHGFNGALVAILVFLILQSIAIAKAESTPRNYWLALWVAVVWVVHPINTIPVLLAVQRMTLLSGTFSLMALVCHLKALPVEPSKSIQWGWLTAGWLLLWPLAVLSKETGLLVPLFALTIAFVQWRRSSALMRNRQLMWLSFVLAALLLAFGIAIGSYLGWNWLSGAYSMRPFTLPERLMTEARVLWFYAAQTLLPDYEQFAIYHDDFRLSTTLSSPPTTWMAIASWGAVVMTIAHFRSAFPVACFAGAWFLMGHGLESTFLPLELVHEYRNYMPSIGLILGVGWMGMTALEKVKLDHAKVTTGLVAAVIIALCVVISWTRACQLGDPLVGLQIEAERHPLSARANYAAAVALIQAQYGDKGDSLGAQSIHYYLNQASKVDPSFKLASLSLMIWACGSDRSIKASWVDDFASRLATTPFGPQDMDLPLLLLRPLVAMPECVQHADVLKLFMAPLANPKVPNGVKARFLEAVADYELLVALSPRSARGFLQKAALLAPSDNALIQKLKGVSSMDERANGGSQKGGS